MRNIIFIIVLALNFACSSEVENPSNDFGNEDFKLENFNVSVLNFLKAKSICTNRSSQVFIYNTSSETCNECLKGQLAKLISFLENENRKIFFVTNDPEIIIKTRNIKNVENHIFEKTEFEHYNIFHSNIYCYVLNDFDKLESKIVNETFY